MREEQVTAPIMGTDTSHLLSTLHPTFGLGVVLHPSQRSQNEFKGLAFDPSLLLQDPWGPNTISLRNLGVEVNAGPKLSPCYHRRVTLKYAACQA